MATKCINLHEVKGHSFASEEDVHTEKMQKSSVESLSISIFFHLISLNHKSTRSIFQVCLFKALDGDKMKRAATVPQAQAQAQA